jgi:hypothetical protein
MRHLRLHIFLFHLEPSGTTRRLDIVPPLAGILIIMALTGIQMMTAT